MNHTSTQPEPRLRWWGADPAASTSAVVLLLHGGRVRSTRPARPVQAAYLRMLAMGRWLHRDLGGAGVAVALLRDRYRGWNEPARHPVVDARWAIEACRSRFPHVPITLLGHSMGARAALRLAGEAGVCAVCALAPWIEPGEPVEQLGGRTVRIVHGTRDTWTDPAASRRYAERAGVSWQAVQGAGHAMLRRRAGHRGRPLVSRVAVIGSGIAGLTAAYLLQRRHEVLLFEAADRLGGHAHTHDVFTADGTQLAVDTGFIVHNERTYPNLLRLFGELGVRTRTSEMSMSVRCLGCGLEYAGGRGPSGLFAQRRNFARPAFLRTLAELPRFHRDAMRLLEEGSADTTLGEFLRTNRYSGYFVEHLVLPLVSAVWSSGATDARRYPARYLFTFLRHHGLLAVGGSPTWRTVDGGSRHYVQRAVKQLTAVLPATPIRSVRRHPDGVTLRDGGDDVHEVDRVVIATHPDQALRMLADPSAAERRVLGAFRYSRNETLLHHDTSVLPRRPGARASWNYLKPGCRSASEQVLVSYDLTRLMRLPGEETQVVSLNAADRVDERSVRARMVYEHPVYTHGSVAAQAELPDLGGARTGYAGAYHGWGFHEDGCASGVRAAAQFGVAWT